MDIPQAVPMYRRRGEWLGRLRGVFGVATSLLLACSTQEGGLPPDLQDPSVLQTPDGAMALYRGVLSRLPAAFDVAMIGVGILTDELAASPMPVGVSASMTLADSRQDLSGRYFNGAPEISYYNFHAIRGEVLEALGFLSAYVPGGAPTQRGHLYALQGYAEMLLADLFCSGIPLSTLDFGADYTLAAGSTTAEVYTHAVALFDTALTLLADNIELEPFAAVGRGRALLALGRYAEAAEAVAAVPDDYAYQVINDDPARHSAGAFAPASQSGLANLRVADREGLTGLDYRSSGDPRVAVTVGAPNTAGHVSYWPSKYPLSGAITIVIANGIEARLIEAEAALQTGVGDGRWLSVLNHLRQTAWTSIVPATGGPLPDLADPGPDDAGTDALRVDLLFRERAFWLYLTAHRQGDLRRLIRQYRRAPDMVYPTGSYLGGNGSYGEEIVVPVPAKERELNSKYTGCINRSA